MVELKRISIDLIDRCTDSRRVDPNWVTAIAEGITHGDVPSPIDVIQHCDRYQQIFGQHRLAAADQAGGTEIDARVFQPADFIDEHAIKLHQIKENLMQRPLSALDKAIAWNEWKVAYEAQNPTHKHGGRRVESTDEDMSAIIARRFSDMAAEALGVSERTIQKSIKIATSLSPEAIERISLTWLAEKQTELEALAASRSIGDLKIIDLIFDEDSPAQTVSDAITIIESGALVKEKPDPVAKTMDKFSRFNLKQKETFFELNEQDIRAWLSKRDKSRSAS